MTYINTQMHQFVEETSNTNGILVFVEIRKHSFPQVYLLIRVRGMLYYNSGLHIKAHIATNMWTLPGVYGSDTHLPSRVWFK